MAGRSVHKNLVGVPVLQKITSTNAGLMIRQPSAILEPNLAGYAEVGSPMKTFDFQRASSKHPEGKQNSAIIPHPIGFQARAICNNKVLTAPARGSGYRNPWSREEDKDLIKLVKDLGVDQWAAISKNLPSRDRKQCRQRWIYHLNPDINKEERFSVEEENTFETMHKKLGNKWAAIAKSLPGRTNKDVLCYYNRIQRRIGSKKRDQKWAEKATRDRIRKSGRRNVGSAFIRGAPTEFGRAPLPVKYWSLPAYISKRTGASLLPVMPGTHQGANTFATSAPTIPLFYGPVTSRTRIAGDAQAAILTPTTANSPSVFDRHTDTALHSREYTATPIRSSHLLPNPRSGKLPSGMRDKQNSDSINAVFPLCKPLKLPPVSSFPLPAIFSRPNYSFPVSREQQDRMETVSGPVRARRSKLEERYTNPPHGIRAAFPATKAAPLPGYFKYPLDTVAAATSRSSHAASKNPNIVVRRTSKGRNLNMPPYVATGASSSTHVNDQDACA